MSFEAIEKHLGTQEGPPIEDITDIEDIADITDIVPVEPSRTITTTQSEIIDDYESSRKSLKSLIEIGEDAIKDLVIVCRESDSPRAYEVLATLMKTAADTTDKLMTLQRSKRDLTKEDKPTNVTNNQNLYVGSTKEFLEMINKKEKPIELNE
jgi:hypothetical protein